MQNSLMVFSNSHKSAVSPCAVTLGSEASLLTAKALDATTPESQVELLARGVVPTHRTHLTAPARLRQRAREEVGDPLR